MGKTAAIPMDKEIQNFLFIFTGQQYFEIIFDNPDFSRLFVPFSHDTLHI